MRLRLAELMEQHPTLNTPYAVMTASDGRISRSAIYRLAKRDGRVENFANDLLEALCDVFDVGPGELLERDRPEGKGRRPARRRA